MADMPEGPHEIIARAYAEHAPKRAFVGFSGGYDSLVATHWAMTNVPGCEVFHCNTGIGVEATRQFVRDTCATFGWKLHEIRAKEDCGQDYDDLVRRFGFPGPARHGMMYNRLKDRCVDRLVKTTKAARSDRTMLITGVYAEESNRRARYKSRTVNTHKTKVWVNPLYFWSKEQFAAYRRQHELPANPVRDLLGMSGECLCGAFAHKGEKALVRIVCPTTADRLDRLEVEARALGHDWGWEDRPPKRSRASPVGIMCQGCGKAA